MQMLRFEHSLTRSYQNVWFTWVTIVGGIATTALFSIISIAASGYESKLVTEPNPNITEHPPSPAWYQKQPWVLANKIPSSCQDQIFTVGSEVYTNQLGYRHQLYALGGDPSALETRQISFPYHHSPLEGCAVESITFTVTRKGLTCSIYSRGNPLTILLSANSNFTWNSTVYSESSGSQELPSWVFWTNLVLNAHIYSMSSLVEAQTDSTSWEVHAIYHFAADEDSLDKSLVYSTLRLMYQNTTLATRLGGVWLDTANPPDETFLDDADTQSNVSLSTWTSTFGLDALSMFDSFREDAQPPTQLQNTSLLSGRFASRADSIAKILHAALWADLGQNSSASMYAHPQLFWEYAQAETVMDDTFPAGNVSFIEALAQWVSPRSRPPYNFNETSRQNINTFFEWAQLEAPSVTPSFFNTLYLCQVPRRKPVLSLILAVVIADLVALQTFWKTLNYVAKLVVERHDSEANYCAGCVNMQGDKGVVRNVEANTSDTNLPGSSSYTHDPPFVSDDIAKPKSIVRSRPVGTSSQLPDEYLEESKTLLSDKR